MAEGSKWVELVKAPDRITGEIWTDILKQEGVPAMIHAEDTMSSLWGVSWIPCRIMVPEDRLAQAKEILDSLEKEEPPLDE